MSKNLENALAALDVGPQQSAEHGYGTDHAPERCARCQLAPPVDDGDICAPCRAFLLGDTDDDPKRRQPLRTGEDGWITGYLVMRPLAEPDSYTFTIEGDGQVWQVLEDGTRHAVHLDPVSIDQAIAAFSQFMRSFAVAVMPVIDYVADTFSALGASTIEAARALTSNIEAAYVREAAVSMGLSLDEWHELGGPPPHVVHARERELEQLDRHRRSHRRTNRWGPPPGR